MGRLGQYAMAHAYRSDLILCCTDGYGPVPGHPPREPTIWVLTADGEKPASWGRVIRLDHHNDTH